MITLPRYIIDRETGQWAIWDTIEHEYTGFEYPYTPEGKEEATKKCQSFNERTINT